MRIERVVILSGEFLKKLALHKGRGLETCYCLDGRLWYSPVQWISTLPRFLLCSGCIVSLLFELGPGGVHTSVVFGIGAHG